MILTSNNGSRERGFKMGILNELLKKTIELNASDLHICAGQPPQVRIDGSLKPISGTKPLSADDAKNICLEPLSDVQRKKIASSKEIDFSFSIGKNARIS